MAGRGRPGQRSGPGRYSWTHLFVVGGVGILLLMLLSDQMLSSDDSNALAVRSEEELRAERDQNFAAEKRARAEQLYAETQAQQAKQELQTEMQEQQQLTVETSNGDEVSITAGAAPNTAVILAEAQALAEANQIVTGTLQAMDDGAPTAFEEEEFEPLPAWAPKQVVYEPPPPVVAGEYEGAAGDAVAADSTIASAIAAEEEVELEMEMAAAPAEPVEVPLPPFVEESKYRDVLRQNLYSLLPDFSSSGGQHGRPQDLCIRPAPLQIGDRISTVRMGTNHFGIVTAWDPVIGVADAEWESTYASRHGQIDPLPPRIGMEKIFHNRHKLDGCCLPQFYLLGPQKSGTTDMWQRIMAHPQIIAPQYKEPHFWMDHVFLTGKENTTISEKHRTLAQYCHRYPWTADKPQHISGDGSPSALYLHTGDTFSTARLLASVQPRARLLVILRDPIERTYSDFNFFSFHTRASPTTFHQSLRLRLAAIEKCFEERTLTECAHDPIFASRGKDTRYDQDFSGRPMVSIYYPYIQDWLEHYPRGNLLVLRLEDYAQHPRAFLQKIFTHLQVDEPSDELLELIISLETENKARPYKPMLAKTKRMLVEFFEPWNAKLLDLLGDFRIPGPSENATSTYSWEEQGPELWNYVHGRPPRLR